MKPLLVAVLSAFLFVGCGGGTDSSPEPQESEGTAAGTAGDESAGDESEGAAEDAMPDQSDPQTVLEQFVEAIRAKDKEACLALIHPDNREELGRDMDEGFPPVPDDPELSVEVSGDSATFTGVPALDKLELRKSDGQWWIAD